MLHRGPWLHDGRATTLEETLDGTCRALDAHGVEDPVRRARTVELLRAL